MFLAGSLRTEARLYNLRRPLEIKMVTRRHGESLFGLNEDKLIQFLVNRNFIHWRSFMAPA